jgi:hypothetical protein
MARKGAHRRQNLLIGSLSDGDFRAWGLVLSAAAWIGLIVCIPIAPPLARTMFAVLDALTWGEAAATYFPVDDSVEFTLMSAGASVAILILAGSVMVWLQITSVMIAMFVVFGGLSLLFQVHGFRRRHAGGSDTVMSPDPALNLDDAQMDGPA